MSEGKSLDPTPVSEGKSLDPTPVSEGKSLDPTPVSEGKSLEPTPVSEGKSLDPNPISEGKALDPTPVSEGKSLDPTLMSEGKSLDPNPISEGKSLDPTPVSEGKSLDPTPISEGKSLDPTPVSEGKSLEPTPVSEGKSLDPTLMSEGKSLDPNPISEGKSLDPTPISEGKSLDPTPVSEGKSLDPTPISEGKSLDPTLMSEGKSLDPNPISEGKSLDPTPISEGKSLDPTPISEGKSLDPNPISEGKSLDPTPVSDGKSLSPTPVSEGKSLDPNPMYMINDLDPEFRNPIYTQYNETCNSMPTVLSESVSGSAIQEDGDPCTESCAGIDSRDAEHGSNEIRGNEPSNDIASDDGNFQPYAVTLGQDELWSCETGPTETQTKDPPENIKDAPNVTSGSDTTHTLAGCGPSNSADVSVSIEDDSNIQNIGDPSIAHPKISPNDLTPNLMYVPNAPALPQRPSYGFSYRCVGVVITATILSTCIFGGIFAAMHQTKGDQSEADTIYTTGRASVTDHKSMTTSTNGYAKESSPEVTPFPMSKTSQENGGNLESTISSGKGRKEKGTSITNHRAAESADKGRIVTDTPPESIVEDRLVIFGKWSQSLFKMFKMFSQ
ncbi:hypothetical protein Bbelb_177980 [Branchiostoma belcheri]|nr:hypothetical protein Bbelb_177980 [Branchiostoma belcheri]